MKLNQFKIKHFWPKFLLSFLLSALIFSIYFVCFAADLANHVQADADFQWSSYSLLILFRLLMYFSIPFLVCLFLDCWHYKEIHKNNKKFRLRLLDNFNIQFALYGLIAGIYTLFGLDKYLGVEIFGSADVFLFVASFAFSILIKQKIPTSVELD